ncbi:MAG: hypothetical protein CK426_03905 [Legionella sp.]|nr:MAG: hypothetical protein CK423_02905 [Legionella sp.]PJD98971.1 MAG: hypothetical protein CK426_03905 [Legionella sp.]
MSVYMTEEEQLEAIKKWWNKHGNKILTIVSVVLLCIAGYRYFYWHQQKMSQQASTVYENMMVSYSRHNFKSVRAYANELIKDYGHTVYADAAHMTLAKVFIEKEKINRAKKELYAVSEKAHMPQLKQIAKIRLARILTVEKEYGNALKELNAMNDPAYLSVINELKGDVYSATGEFDNAIKAYRMAMSEAKNNGMGNSFLEMKSNELAIKTQKIIANEHQKTT